MKNTRIYDRVPVKDVRVKDPLIGTRTPQILISRKGGEYLRGDVLDANATTELAKSIHMPDIDKINEKLELTVNKDLIGLPNGVAGLDSTGSVPVNQLSNISTDLFIVVSELPTEDIKEGKIYCIRDTKSTAQDNNYIEYAYINNKWEKIGEFQAEPDLSGYAKLSGAIFSGNITSPIVTAEDRIQINQLTKYNNRYLAVQNPIDRGNNIVFATDGSIVDLSTKANASDVLLKKSANGGYYIEENNNELGLCAFAANSNCTASGYCSHAEGNNTKASGYCSHAEGYGTTASVDYSHAEGDSTTASGDRSHAEGDSTTASGGRSHAEGYNTKVSGYCSHAEGYGTTASGDRSHAEGEGTTARGYCSHAEGEGTTASGNYSHAEGDSTTASGDRSHAEGYNTKASGNYSHAEGYGTTASGGRSHAEGEGTTASGDRSHAEGEGTTASGWYSHAEGEGTTARGYCSHALGINNVDDKNAIYSVGIGNTATKKNAEYIYAKNSENGFSLTDDPKNGYKYLIGVGGYDGISTDNTTYKSVQEVIADLTARIEQLETKVRALEAANTPA